MAFSVRGQEFTKLNKLVNDLKVAFENSKDRDYLSPFETNVWSHISLHVLKVVACALVSFARTP